VVSVKSKELIEIVFHGRGGQGAVTAADILCELAFASGFKDMMSIPIIGAERRGAPIRAFCRLSKDKVIKIFCDISQPDFTLVFDYTLLDIPSVVSSIKTGTIIVNAPDFVKFNCIPENIPVWRVDATGIAIKNNLVVAGYPILNTLMLGAYAKVTQHYSINVMKKVYDEKYGSKGSKNYIAAKEAYDTVVKVRD
jgi:pyruvate ferredoxin oxidoreductase gamma subunit